MSFYERPAPRPPRPLSYLVPLVLLLLAGGLVIWRYWPHAGGGLDANATPRTVTPRGDLSELEKATIQIFKDASPSVVHITTLAAQRDAFSMDVQEVPEGTGSGFLWDDQGRVVTNFHVIRGADSAKVTLADHSSWSARLVGAYPDGDLAVLWIEAPKSRLRPLPIGTSSDLQVGQSAFAIGNPFGLDQTLTRGIVSALDREIRSVTKQPIKGVIQTDAAINPGNSGGPLLDSAGRLIGVNTAIFSPSGVSVGIGFAIPVDDVNRIVPQLIQHGKVIRPRMGVRLAPDQVTAKAGIKGVLIMDVVPDGPAAKAGLRPTRQTREGDVELGDAIVAIDGQPIQKSDQVFKLLENYKIGDTVTVTYERDGQRHEAKLVLEAVASKL
jgi:S1-C subfamily serine protease